MAFAKLVALLNAIEDGPEWPEDVTTARAAFLANDVDRFEDPLAYRVLLIMPVLYRRWACCRLRAMAHWIKRWQLQEMVAGVAEMGADDAWWETALDLEEHLLNGTPFSGAGVDVFKCFDQIVRDLVYRLAETAGMPSKVLRTYKKYQEGLQTRNAVAGGLGTPYKRFMGIPQGCPMSMMIIILILRAWLIEMRETNVKPRDLADDLLMVASGPQHEHSIKEAVEKAYDYMQDMGGESGHPKVVTFLLLPDGQAKTAAACLEMRQTHSGSRPHEGSWCSHCHCQQRLLDHPQSQATAEHQNDTQDRPPSREIQEKGPRHTD